MSLEGTRLFSPVAGLSPTLVIQLLPKEKHERVQLVWLPQQIPKTLSSSTKLLLPFHSSDRTLMWQNPVGS